MESFASLQKRSQNCEGCHVQDSQEFLFSVQKEAWEVDSLKRVLSVYNIQRTEMKLQKTRTYLENTLLVSGQNKQDKYIACQSTLSLMIW